MQKPTIAVVSDFSHNNPVGGYARRVARVMQRQKPKHKIIFADSKALQWLYNPVQQSRPRFDDAMAAILEEVKKADVTHLHLELGLYGNDLDMMRRNILGIIQASRKLVLFVHSLHMNAETFAPLYREIIGAVQDKSRIHSTIIHANNRKDVHQLKTMFDGTLVYAPVLYFSAAIRRFFIRRAAAQRAVQTDGVKRIGVFGFINGHKDFETTLRAFALLPAHYHLVIVGGAHPGERKLDKKNEHIAALDRLIWDLRGFGFNIIDRITFRDGLGDKAFFDEMAGLDVVIINYLETQMSASSVLSQAHELQVPIVASRCTTFEMALDHFGQAVSFFDPGNSIQLRQKILAAQPPGTCPPCRHALEDFCRMIAL